MKPKNCIFCDIVNKKAFAAIIYEDEDILAFIDIKPINEGHTLIIPKKHIQLVQDLDEKIYAKIHAVGVKIAKRLREKIPKTDAINFYIADGEAAGQEILHMHLHVVPRRKKDGFGYIFDPSYYSTMLTEEERAKVKNKLIPI